MKKKTISKQINAEKPSKPSLYERIFNVQAGLQTVLKSAKHGGSSYMYATERDFIAEIKPLLRENKLMVLPTTIDLIVTQNNDAQNAYRVCVEYTIINAEKPTEKTAPIIFWGAGEDKKGSVVGLPIAYTMSLKYFLAKTFIAETGADAEAQEEKDSKNTKGAPRGESPEQATETIKRMLKSSRNIDGMREYITVKLPQIKTLTSTQKADIEKAATDRIAELEAAESAQATTKQAPLIK